MRAPVQTTYFISDTVLEHVGEIRDLGIILDTKLTFAPQVTNVVRRANRSMDYSFARFKPVLPAQSLT